jgi:hypothetical protein
MQDIITIIQNYSYMIGGVGIVSWAGKYYNANNGKETAKETAKKKAWRWKR